ncbi:MAG: hypothetical protein GPJ52_03830 [Candidatus Heimdallarchaeota archaeon]|nr:hypothetical protein [Candidatus Heimdallarchaeota archaeon]
MNEEKHEEKAILERYDYHRKQHEKWLAWSIFPTFLTVMVIAAPIGLPLLIICMVKMTKHAKAHKQIAKECFLKSMENGVDKEKFEKMYQYMKDQKRWWG